MITVYKYLQVKYKWRELFTVSEDGKEKQLPEAKEKDI